MKKIKLILKILILIIVVNYIFSASNISSLTGTIKNQNNDPIQGVALRIGAYTTYTDQKGNYKFDVLSIRTKYIIEVFYLNDIFNSFKIETIQNENIINFIINLQNKSISMN